MDRYRIDSEYLIEAIKKHPSIWHKGSKAYNNRALKEQSWLQVGEDLVDSWSCMTEDEKMIKIYDFKKRWGNIRDYYKKDVALQVNGQIGTTSKRKKYIFSKQLEFLKPFFVSKSDTSCKEETEDDQAEETEYLEAIDSSDSENSLPLKRKKVNTEENKDRDRTVDWSSSGMEKKIESELLIEAIKKHDSIWNRDSRNYHKKNRKESSWTKVCEELVENWNSMNEDEQFNRKQELKKRWSNIRDYYKKDVALELNGQIGQPAMKRQKYVFSKQLEFLRPFFDKSFTYDPEQEEQEEQDQEIEEQTVFLEPMYSSDTESSLPPKTQKIVLNSERKTLELTPKVSMTDAESIEDNSDYMFLKSLVPDMKAMTREQKVDFKMGVLQLYKNIMGERRYRESYFGEDTKNPLQ